MLFVSSFAQAATVYEDPSSGEMIADALVARPLLLATTVLGTGLYLVSLPFSLASGTADTAGKSLVVGPAKATFVRCLGCRVTGYHFDAEG